MAAQQETNSSARKSLVLLPHHPPIATSLQDRHMHTCISEPRENLAFQDLLEESITNLEAVSPPPADEVQEYISDQATPTASCRQETSYVMSASTLAMASYQPLFHLKSFITIESRLQQETDSSTSSALVLMPNRPLN